MASSHLEACDGIHSNQDGEHGRDEPPSFSIAPIASSSDSDVPSERGGATLTQTRDGVVYLVGGANREATSFGDVHALDLATKRWRLLTPSRGSLPARSGHSTVALGSELLVFGGLNALDGTVYNDIHVFDTDARTWTQVEAQGAAPAPRNAHAAVLLPPADLGGRDRRQRAMLVFGGSSPHHGTVGDAFLLHLDSGEAAADGSSTRRKFRWEKLSCAGEQPEARELHCGVRASDASVYFVGGRNQHGDLCTDLAILDTASWTWQVVPVCGWARCSHAVGLLDGALVSFGGFDGASVCGDSWYFDDHVDEWRPAVSAADGAASPRVPERFGHCGATVEVPTTMRDDGGNGSDGGDGVSSGDKEAEERGKETNNTDLRATRALLVFGGMNAESDLNDLALVTRVR